MPPHVLQPAPVWLLAFPATERICDSLSAQTHFDSLPSLTMQSFIACVERERGWIGKEKKEGERALRVPGLCQDTFPQRP